MPPGTYARNRHPDEWVPEPTGFVLHPDDILGVEPHPDVSRLYGCCGLAGTDGRLNLVCAGCGNELATLQADCYTQNQVTLDFVRTIRSYCREPD